MPQNTNGSSNGNYSKASDLAYTDRVPTEEQILQAGEEVAHLLNSPHFNLAYQTTIKQLQDEWAGTEEHEENKRKALYWMLRALPRVMWVLRDAVAAAQQVNEKRLQEEERAQYDYRAQYRPPSPLP